MTRDLTNTMICWNPGTDQIALVPWPGRGARRDLALSAGACNLHVSAASFEERKTMAYIIAMQIIVRDGCPADVVHRVMLELDEYRHGCSYDMPGAREARERHGEEQPGMFG